MKELSIDWSDLLMISGTLHQASDPFWSKPFQRSLLVLGSVKFETNGISFGQQLHPSIVLLAIQVSMHCFHK